MKDNQFVAFRRDLHRFAETSGKEFETTEKIKAIAIKHGVRAEQITYMPSTGLWIDLRGEAPPHGRDVCIALRADIDALEMTEGNEGLQYRSVRVGAAHMCGHDGHTATLAATIPLFLAKAPTIPNNKRLRLIFQPAEEAVCDEGAVDMIKAGCLEGVDQIYGFHNHNIPLIQFGYFSCKQGPIMASIAHLKITIKGTGGHGSQPEKVKFALPEAIDLYSKLIKLDDELKKKYGNVFTIMLPILKSGQRFNVISETVQLQGSLRTFSTDISKIIISKIKEWLKLIESNGFQVSFNHAETGVTANHKNQADHVFRVAKKMYGEEMVGSIGLPVKSSEDFGRYTDIIPGAFFFVSGADAQHAGIPHNPNYNFNDKLIPIVSNFWIALLEDRFAQ